MLNIDGDLQLTLEHSPDLGFPPRTRMVLFDIEPNPRDPTMAFSSVRDIWDFDLNSTELEDYVEGEGYEFVIPRGVFRAIVPTDEVEEVDAWLGVNNVQHQFARFGNFVLYALQTENDALMWKIRWSDE